MWSDEQIGVSSVLHGSFSVNSARFVKLLIELYGL